MPLIEIHRHYHLHGDKNINKQSETSKVILAVQAVLGICWLTMIALTLAKVPFAVHLGSKVLWVAVISYYANAFTNFGGATSAFSALVSGKAHEDAEHSVSGIADVEADIDSKYDSP